MTLVRLLAAETRSRAISFFRAATAPVNGLLRSHSNPPLLAHRMLITAWFAVNYVANCV